MHHREADRRCEEIGDLWFLYHLMHALIHLLVQYHDTFHLLLIFEASFYEMFDLKLSTMSSPCPVPWQLSSPAYIWSIFLWNVWSKRNYLLCLPLSGCSSYFITLFISMSITLSSYIIKMKATVDFKKCKKYNLSKVCFLWYLGR